MRKLLFGSALLPLLWLMSGQTWADAAGGAEIFKTKDCNGCHYTEGPAKEKTIEDQLAKKGPELWYAGSKFQAQWLDAWLQDPQIIRLLEYNSLDQPNPGGHAKLAADEAAQVAAFLMTLTSDVVVAGKVKPKSNPKGKLIFKKKMPCSGCHQYEDRGKILGGKSGPSLVGAGTRLNPDWILAYLKNPAEFKPVKMMPVFAGLMKEKDMEKVAAHVATF
ncbi:MAG: c-type cytochrome [Halieaceae bacterium]|jgi:cytochrome c2|nr:c-type cytochrome [Halieaceae bacterium]